jgi:hypothetical protein
LIWKSDPRLEENRITESFHQAGEWQLKASPNNFRPSTSGEAAWISRRARALAESLHWVQSTRMSCPVRLFQAASGVWVGHRERAFHHFPANSLPRVSSMNRIRLNPCPYTRS